MKNIGSVFIETVNKIDMIQDTLKTEIKNDIKNTLSKHGLMRGDKYAAEILQELATEFSKNIIVSSLYPPY